MCSSSRRPAAAGSGRPELQRPASRGVWPLRTPRCHRDRSDHASRGEWTGLTPNVQRIGVRPVLESRSRRVLCRDPGAILGKARLLRRRPATQPFRRASSCADRRALAHRTRAVPWGRPPARSGRPGAGACGRARARRVPARRRSARRRDATRRAARPA